LKYQTWNDTAFAGNYRLTLSVTNTNTNCAASDSNIIQVLQHPFVSYTGPAEMCSSGPPLNLKSKNPINGTINSIYNLSIKPTAFLGDTNYTKQLDSTVFSGNIFNPTDHPGKWDFKSTVANQNCMRSANFTIDVKLGPVAKFLVLPDTILNVDFPEFTFDNKSHILSGKPLIYHWDFGTGNPQDTSNLAQVSFMYPKTGASYFTTLVAKSENGCLDSAIRKLTVFYALKSNPINNFNTKFYLDNTLRFYSTSMEFVNLTIYDNIGRKLAFSSANEALTLPPGTYIYSLSVKENGKIRIFCNRILIQ
jgi:hypothetical protein